MAERGGGSPQGNVKEKQKRIKEGAANGVKRRSPAIFFSFTAGKEIAKAGQRMLSENENGSCVPENAKIWP